MLKVEAKNTMAGQFQIEYAAYMMLASYFKKAICQSKVIEKKMYLHYQDLSSKRQEDLEVVIINLLEKSLLHILSMNDIETEEVFISFVPYDKGHIIRIKGARTNVNLIFRKRDGKVQYAVVNTGFEEKHVHWMPAQICTRKRSRVETTAQN